MAQVAAVGAVHRRWTGSTALASTIAHHFEAADMPSEAARHRLMAGRWALRLAAYDEALAHLERGLTPLEALPASRERLGLEMGLWVARLNPSPFRYDWQGAPFTRTLARVAELTRHPPTVPQARRSALSSA